MGCFCFLGIRNTAEAVSVNIVLTWDLMDLHISTAEMQFQNQEIMASCTVGYFASQCLFLSKNFIEL